MNENIVEPVGFAGAMPGTNGGFTMATFMGKDAPAGTALYAAGSVVKLIAERDALRQEAATDADVIHKLTEEVDRLAARCRSLEETNEGLERAIKALPLPPETIVRDICPIGYEHLRPCSINATTANVLGLYAALATQEVVGGKTADSPPQQERAAVPDGGGVFLPRYFFDFLLGQGQLEGFWFGDKPATERGQFWWRNRLRELRAAPAAPMSEQGAVLPATPESECNERNAVSAEPVAYVWPGYLDGLKANEGRKHFEHAELWNEPTGQAGVPLYTHPTPRAQTEKPSACAASESSQAPSAATLGGLREALDSIVRCAYPVDKSINRRGYDWDFSRLDEALADARALLATPPTEQAKPSEPEVHSASMYGFAHRKPEPVAAPAQVTDAEVEAMRMAYDEISPPDACFTDADPMRAAGNALLALRSQANEPLALRSQGGMAQGVVCEWTYEPDMDTWHAGCGQMWVLTADTPAENGMNYCPFCGDVLAGQLEQPASPAAITKECGR